MAGPMTPEELQRYADMVVRGCIAFRRGDELLVRTIFPHRDFAVALTEAAYRAGLMKEEGSTKDYTKLFDGFRERARFATGVSNGDFIAIDARKVA